MILHFFRGITSEKVQLRTEGEREQTAAPSEYQYQRARDTCHQNDRKQVKLLNIYVNNRKVTNKYSTR